MKAIKRDVYLNRLISRKENGLIKIITGIRRCGKSYLLNEIFVNHLKESGVKEDHIIKLALDREENKKYHDSKLLNEYIHSNIKDKNMHYVILDEIQLVEGFEFVLNGLLYEKNIFRLLKNIILQILVYVMLDWILDNKRKIISWKTSYIMNYY